MSRGSEWIVLSRELVVDVIDLLGAEIDAGRRELAAGWSRAWLILVFFLGALALSFWIVALLAYTLVALAMLWLPAWGAGLAVAGVFLFVALVLVLLGWLRLKRLDNPFDVIMRRFHDHLEWWRSEVAPLPRPAPPPRTEEERLGGSP